LRKLAAENGEPGLFADAGWALLGTSTLSTSCLRSESIRGFSFGPVVSDGYGIGYVYDQTGVSLNVTNYTHPGPGGIRTDSRAFASALERAMIFIERLLDSNTRSRL